MVTNSLFTSIHLFSVQFIQPKKRQIINKQSQRWIWLPIICILYRYHYNIVVVNSLDRDNHGVKVVTALRRTTIVWTKCLGDPSSVLTAGNPTDQYCRPKSDTITAAKNFPMIPEMGKKKKKKYPLITDTVASACMCVRGPNCKPGSPSARGRLISDEVIIADWITSIVNQSLAEG